MYPNRVHFPGASLVAGLLTLGYAGAALGASYTVRPEVEVEQTLDDNVLSAENERGDGGPSNEISSWNTRMAPRVTLKRKSDTSEASLLLGLSRRETWSLSELDGTDEQLRASMRRTLSPRLTVGGSARYQFYAAYNAIEENLADGTQQFFFDERPELDDRGFATDLRYIVDDTTELTGELEWNAREYGRTSRTDLFDTENRSLSLTLSRQLTARDRAGVHLGLSSSDEENSETGFLPVFFSGFFIGYDSTTTRNHDELGTGLLFWQRTWSPRWTTALQAGARTLHSENENHVVQLDTLGNLFGVFNSPKQSDSGTGFLGGASATYSYSDHGRLDLSYSRDTRTGTSGSTGASAIDTDSLSVGLTQRLAKRLTLTMRGSYVLYETTAESLQAGTTVDAGSDSRLRFGELRLEWQARKNLVAYTRFTYSDVDQQRPPSASGADRDRDYARRILGFGVRYFFDQDQEL